MNGMQGARYCPYALCARNQEDVCVESKRDLLADRYAAECKQQQVGQMIGRQGPRYVEQRLWRVYLRAGAWLRQRSWESQCVGAILFVKVVCVCAIIVFAIGHVNLLAMASVRLVTLLTSRGMYVHIDGHTGSEMHVRRAWLHGKTCFAVI